MKSKFNQSQMKIHSLKFTQKYGLQKFDTLIFREGKFKYMYLLMPLGIFEGVAVNTNI